MELKVKKYEGAVHSSGGDRWVEMEESYCGKYVSIEDYEKLHERLASLESENLNYRAQVTYLTTGLSVADSTLANYKTEIDSLKEIVTAVAHVGVDFGYGNFVLSDEDIKKARYLLSANLEEIKDHISTPD